MSLQDTLQAITSRESATEDVTSASLADDARNIMAALLVRPSADVRHMIECFAPIAEVFLQNLIDGKYPDATLALRAKYASLALARAGFGPIHNVRAITATLTKDDIEAIKSRAVAYAMHDSATRIAERSSNTSINPPASQVLPIPLSDTIISD